MLHIDLSFDSKSNFSALILSSQELLTIVLFLIIAITGFVAGWPGISYAPWIFLGSFFLSIVYPSFSIITFIIGLPLFGNRPGSHQSLYLLLVGSAVTTGSLCNLYLRRIYISANLKLQNPLLFLGALYFIVSALSLISLPWGGIFADYKGRFGTSLDYSIFSFSFWNLFRATEETLEYSILSVAWTAISLTLGFLIVSLVREKRERALTFSFALLIGLLHSLLFGLLDYYESIDLRAIRSLDPVVNPGDVQFRLQSFFGHSGWFAEYVTLSIPFGMTILALGLGFSLRVTLLLLLLLAGEFVLILTYQRGGWLSYPLTLFVMWGAVYITRQAENGERDFFRALRKSFFKILVSLPITLLLSLGLLYSLSHTGALPPSAEISRYIERAKEIQKTSDRTNFIRAGFMIGALHPILGAGSESFAYQYRKEFRSPNGPYTGIIDLPLHGSAHNVYMQTFAGKGILGLILLISILFLMILKGFGLPMRNTSLPGFEKIVLLCGGTFAVAFIIYGNVQEIFYVQSLQFLFFVSFGLVAALFDPAVLVSKKWRSIAFFILGGALFSHLFWELYFPFNNNIFERPRVFGCHETETDPTGKQFRWCAKKAQQIFPIKFLNNQYFVDLSVEIIPLTAKETQLNIYSGKELLLEESRKGGVYNLKVPIPVKTAKSALDKQVTLLIDSSTYFIPARDLKGSEDLRILSYKLY